MKVLRLLLKLISALIGLYFMLGGVVIIIAAASQNIPDSRMALRIISGCFLAASLPFLVAVASIKKAKIIAAISLVPASIVFLFLIFTPSLQPDTRMLNLPTVQVVAIAFALLLVARIADAARTVRSRVGP